MIVTFFDFNLFFLSHHGRVLGKTYLTKEIIEPFVLFGLNSGFV